MEENTSANQNIGLPVEADDPNVDATLTYWLGTSTDDGAFSIDTATGQLKTKVPLDKEGQETYNVTVSVRDGKDDNGAADTTEEDGSISVTITVTGVNDAPEITGGPTTVSNYAENSSADVGTYTATDQENDDITWSLSGADRGDFDISSTGVLTFKSAPNFEAPVDADTNNVYLVTVVASDSGKTDTQAVTVTVINVYEPPAFPSSETGACNVVENTGANQNIGTAVSATDPDAGATLTYSLGGTDASSFNFDTATGQIKTKVPLDKETKASYTVIVSATDGLDESGTAQDPAVVDDTVTVTITVTNQNEAPEFTGGSTAVDYAENGTGSVDTCTVTDLDTDAAYLTWTLDGDDEALFDITGGALTFEDLPNFEAKKDKDNDNDYQVTVKVSDGEHTVTRGVTVTVTDVNDPPTFPDTENGARSVEEGTGTGENIGSPVAATDQDGDTLTYSVTGADAAAFTFNTSTGQLQTKDALYADTKDSYSFTVGVSDSKTADGTVDTVVDATITVTITVSGVDEAPDISGDATPSHAENDTSAVGTYADNDPENDSIDWTLSGDDRGDFLISETGELTFKNTPDSETPVD